MRTAIVATFCVCILGASLAAQTVERVPSAGNILTRYLDRANIHPPVHLGRLTVFPISLSSTDRMPETLSMEEALDKGVLVVEELARAEVERARFVNKSDRMIFLMAGEVITGGRQNRTLTTDALLGPKSETVLPLYCVQKGRWQGQEKFASPPAMAPMGVRARAAQSAGQGEVWAEVARANEQLKSADASGDLAAAMSKPENVQRLIEHRKHIVPKLPAGCAGVVVARDATILGADLFNSADLFDRMRGKVLDSYLSQYLGDDLADRGGERITRPDQTDVRSYLQACYQARFSAGEQRGVGRVFHVSGARTGQTLAYEGGVIPVARSREERMIRAEEYMVHTCLMEKIVPVRPAPEPAPVPIPMPTPRLPRPMPRR